MLTVVARFNNIIHKRFQTNVCMSYEMLQYNRIDINKPGAPKECIIYHFWYFKDIDFNCESHVCNGCHDIYFNDSLCIKKHCNSECKRR